MKPMADIPNECRQMESQLKGSGYRVEDLCYHAKLTRAAWQRWKSGEASPTMTNWDSVQKTLTSLLSHQIEVPRRG